VVRERLERLGRLGGTARLPEASLDERRAVADLLGLAALPGPEVVVTLARLDRELLESRFAVGLPEALELLGGPLRNHPAEREAERRHREAVWEEAARHPLLATGAPTAPALQAWLGELRASGLLRRLAAGERSERELLDDALGVLERLPRLSGSETGPGTTVRRGVLASAALGSSHALDPGNPVATLVLRALLHLHRGEDRPTSWPSTAAERRELWESAGVVLDELSSQVLVLGLMPTAPRRRGPIATALHALATAGEPARLTLRQVAQLTAPEEDPPFTLPSAGIVHVCENPVVVAAAADHARGRDGSRAPLICSEGVPSLAARDLLSSLARQGARILYHGDFDWAGARIAGQVSALVASAGAPGSSGAFGPWRFTAADYRRALADGAAGPPLEPPSAPTPWDPELSRAMTEAGVAVEEEAVLDDLLADLEP